MLSRLVCAQVALLNLKGPELAMLHSRRRRPSRFIHIKNNFANIFADPTSFPRGSFAGFFEVVEALRTDAYVPNRKVLIADKRSTRISGLMRIASGARVLDAVSLAYAAAPQETSVEASTATIGAHAPPLATTIDAAISSEPSLLEALPDDLLQAILLACPTSTVLVLTTTCRRLRVAGEYDGLWVSKVRCRYERILPLFAKGPWMPLPSPEDVPCLVRGESPKRFYFSFGPSWMKLAAQGVDVGMGPAQGYCVMVIDGRVYDLTAFVDEHPGEPYLLRAAAGTDASEAFDFIGHSNHARSVLRGYARPDLELLEEEPRLDDARRLLLGSASLRPTVGAGSLSPDASRWARWSARFEDMSSWLESTISNADDKAASRRHLHAMELLTER